MIDKVAEGFNEFEEDLLRIITDTITNVNDLFRELGLRLEECEDFQGVSGCEGFFQGVQVIRDTAQKSLDEAFRVLQHEMEAVRYTSILDNDSYVGEAMQSAYDQCKLVTNNSEPITGRTGRRRYQKSNTHNRRVEIIRQRLKGSVTNRQDSVFESVCDSMCTDFEEKISAWETERCLPKLKKAYNNVVLEFERRFAVTEEVKLEKDVEAIETLKAAANEALQAIEGPLAAHIKTFEDYEKSGKKGAPV